MGLKPGVVGEAEEYVLGENTAIRCGSGDVEVYATPALVALIERAAVAALRPFLPEGVTSVGTLVEVRHQAATPVGLRVRARSELVEVDGRRVIFKAEVYDERERIAEARHERFLVQRERFLKRVLDKRRG